MAPRTLALAVMALLLAGCAAAPAESIAPTPVPSPPPTAVIDVPRQSSELAPVEQLAAPVRIQIPSVSIDIQITPVGVEDDGLMQIPEDIRVAGWYRYGPSPASDTGSTVITAHVDDFEQGLGPFAYLKEMPADAEIIVTTDDGVDHRYVLESVQNIEKKQLPLDQVFDRDGAPRIVLITCGGQFDQNVLNYSDNVIAIANPL
ncbi:sortase family protein [Salinibacterium amurskyense]|uniref:Sortase family protein n=1 Tax=Salinibacterium amurskyense TaxID=205941 RepID=A0A2M9D1V0_9MICO|nr:class F sortase [Salinibacterium amurskyense]PJJ78150.1 sortase family protein [Salinibacterium amurskyense]RLQ80295.1 class F sortase [Salinibacterium amurskyense]GHD82618.1 class F sortase [Salinibacterium amurskyense]